MIRIRWLASFALLSLFFFLSDCSKKKEEKKSYSFNVKIPLEDDYPLLKQALVGIIRLSFPKQSVAVEEGLSDRYEIAPFENWITNSDPDYLLKLQIRVDRSEDLPHVQSFLNRDEINLPFKIKLPKSENSSSEYKGEAMFCRMQAEGRDILSRQLCRTLMQAACFKEIRPQARRLGNVLPVRCELVLVKQESANGEQKAPKFLNLTGFPLPLRVRGDYPFSRYVEADETLLINLFSAP